MTSLWFRDAGDGNTGGDNRNNCCHLLGTSFVPGTGLGTLHTFSQLIPMVISKSRLYFPHFFKSEKTGVQRVSVTCLKSHS